MRKAIGIISTCVAITLLVLFLPIPKGTLTDGGTRVYSALTYKIVAWNKIQVELNEDGSGGETNFYRKTSVYWFPDNYKSIDELWEIESNFLVYSSLAMPRRRFSQLLFLVASSPSASASWAIWHISRNAALVRRSLSLKDCMIARHFSG